MIHTYGYSVCDNSSDNVWLLSTLCGSKQEQQLYVMNATSPLLLFFFFSVFIGSWRTNLKLVSINAALIKSPKAICLCVIGYVNQKI